MCFVCIHFRCRQIGNTCGVTGRLKNIYKRRGQGQDAGGLSTKLKNTALIAQQRDVWWWMVKLKAGVPRISNYVLTLDPGPMIERGGQKLGWQFQSGKTHQINQLQRVIIKKAARK